MKLGMFDPPEKVKFAQIPFSANDSPEHAALALEVARQSIVLLKNAHETLPLKKGLNKIVVAGPYADNTEILLGNYNGTPSHPVTLLQGIVDKAGTGTEVVYCKGFLSVPELVIPIDIGARYLRPGNNSGQSGLKAEYFNNPDLDGDPVVIKVDTLVSPHWRLNAPCEGVGKDHFSVRWSGQLVPDQNGTYEIGFQSDYKGRLYLGDSLVIDNWHPVDYWKYRTTTVELKKGIPLPIRLEYADDIDYAGIWLRWRLVRDSGFDQDLQDELIQALQGADACIFVGGISPELEGEEMDVNAEGFLGGDRTRLDLPSIDEQMLKTVYATGVPTILVLTGGSALSINWANEHIPAILEVWYPGQAGGTALADVLFGDYNPAGRLPVTFYKSVNDLPPFSDYSMKGRTYKFFDGEVLYPFGHGLSYSAFHYLQAYTNAWTYEPDETADLFIEIANSSSIPGEEVVQVYARKLDADHFRPLKTLAGFSRVFIQPGDTISLHITVNIKELRYYDETTGDYRIEPGEYEFLIGASSADIRIRKKIAVGS
jgi:beta-glucosidase